MIQEIMKYLYILGMLVVSNILLGMYYNINVKKFKFDIIKLLNGLVKAFIIVFTFCSLYYAFYEMPQLTEAVGCDPQFVMISAIVIYATKVLKDLSVILGVVKGE